MKSKLLACCLTGLVASACQPTDHVDPSDDPTGQAPPPAAQIFAFDAAAAPRFLDANLQVTNALRAEFTVVNDVLVPMQAGGAFPESAGADANLLAGVGFGTYPNPDRATSEWAEGSFKSVLEADVMLTQSGDAVKFCRSFGTTCVTAQMVADGQGVLLLNLAANVPDVEIGEIAPGISAAIRGTGPSGLTIAITDPTVVAVPFAPAAGTPFELSWTIARGAIPGSLDYAVAVNGNELASGNTAVQMSASIESTGGVALIFDQPVAGGTEYEVDYSYSFNGETSPFDFTSVLDPSVDLTAQAGLTFAPIYVYPTQDPGFELLTLEGAAGAKHVVQPTDGVLGAVIDLPGQAPQARIYSTAFNGDDFEDTLFAGQVDQGGEGGGFYPSPALCYSQVYAAVAQQVVAGARKEAHRLMYASVANGVAGADSALSALAPALGLTYNPIGSAEAYIAIGTDYADNNVDTHITTSEGSTYSVVLTDDRTPTFVTELGDFLVFLEENPEIREDLINDDNGFDEVVHQRLIDLHNALTTSSGSQETYEAGIEIAIKDRILVTNDSGTNPPPEQGPDLRLPVLAAGCLWGAPPAPATEATEATLTGDLENDEPAYPAVEAQAEVPPAREQAAAQINELVMGIYGNFIGQVFGLEAPASNFSLSMEVGDTASGTAPAVSRIVISAQ